MSELLTPGCLKTIMEGQYVKSLVQVLQIQKLARRSGMRDIYKLVLFDGLNTTNRVIFLSETYSKDGGLKYLPQFSIIELIKFTTSIEKSSKSVVIIIEQYQLIRDGKRIEKKIENLDSLDQIYPVVDRAADGLTGSALDTGVQQSNKRYHSALNNGPSSTNDSSTGVSNKRQRLQPSSKLAEPSTSDFDTVHYSSAEFYPISNLTDCQQSWPIKALVTNKTQMMTYKNKNGEGHYFKFGLTDDDGNEINCVAFNEEAKKRYQAIEEGKTYFFFDCVVKKVKSQYRMQQNNDYEITVTYKTCITSCDNIPMQTGVGLSSLMWPWMSFKEAEEMLDCSKALKDIYYVTKAVVLMLPCQWLSTYKACPKRNCKEKISPIGSSYRCSKCKQDFDGFKYSAECPMYVTNFIDSNWVSVSNEVLAKIINLTDAEIIQSMEKDPIECNTAMEKCLYKEFTLKCKTQIVQEKQPEPFSGCYKTEVVEVEPVDFQECNTRLIESINKFIKN